VLAKLEIFSGMVRLWRDGATMRDRYEAAFTIRAVDEDTAEICGVTTPPTRQQLWAVIGELRKRGFTRLRITRDAKRNRVRDIEIGGHGSVIGD
jgi:hypothetical protein